MGEQDPGARYGRGGNRYRDTDKRGGRGGGTKEWEDQRERERERERERGERDRQTDRQTVKSYNSTTTSKRSPPIQQEMTKERQVYYLLYMGPNLCP